MSIRKKLPRELLTFATELVQRYDTWEKSDSDDDQELGDWIVQDWHTFPDAFQVAILVRLFTDAMDLLVTGDGEKKITSSQAAHFKRFAKERLERGVDYILDV